MNLYNYEVDPFNGDSAAYPLIKTAGMGGGATMPDFFVPASANYPPSGSYSGSPTRYFLDVPYIIDITDTTARPITVYSVTGAVTLTRVLTAPNANEYRVSVNTSNRRTVMEFNVSNAGHQVAMQFYALGSTITKDSLLETKAYTVKLSSSDSQNNIYNPLIISTSQDAAVPINYYINLINTLGGGTVYLEAGTYNCNTVINMKSNVILKGSGISTVLKRGANTASVISCGAITGYEISSLKIDGTKATYTSSNVGINGNSVRYAAYKDLYIYNNHGNGMSFCFNVSDVKANGNGVGFTSCQNLVNCVSESSTTYGFGSCSYINNCLAISNGSIGFYSCSYGNNNNSATNTTVGYDSCNYFNNSASNNNTSYGWKDSNYLTGCLSSANATYGFYNCDYCTSCVVTSVTGATRYGFYQSDFAVDCKATINTGNAAYRGFMDCDKISTCHAVSCEYGFYDCNGLSHSRATSGTQGYFNCWADLAGSGAQVVDPTGDQAAYGFNSVG